MAAMNDIQIGIRFRALRHRLGIRQSELGDRAGVSQDAVSRIERGRLEDVALRTIRKVARELDADLQHLLRWRGGDLDRLVDKGHATLVGRIAAMLKASGWQVWIEVSYAVYRESGSIDVLAWHPTTRMLLVVEVKTDLVAVEETLRKHDEKTRLAAKIAGERFGWRATAAARLLVLPSVSTQRRRVERHAAVMDSAYPLRGVALRRWLGTPSGSIAGLLFVDVEFGRGRVAATSRKRIRRPRGAAAEPRQAAA